MSAALTAIEPIPTVVREAPPHLVQVRDLVVEYPASGLRADRPLRAVAGVSLQLRRGEVFGLVGESGSGKTTLARAIMRLIEPVSGSIHFDGVDVTHLAGGEARRLRRRMQIVYQDPAGSLDPRMRVSDLVAEPLRTHEGIRGSEATSRVLSLLTEVGLSERHLGRRAHELSGGQAQRVAIARALALRPELVVLDEPTSALDVSVQAQILNLLADLRDAHGLTYLLISHDLAVVRHLADRIGVMYLGVLVEGSPGEALFVEPRHPYTAALLASAADTGSGAGVVGSTGVGGDVPSPANPPDGCRFHTRCWLREQLARPEQCETVVPPLHQVNAERSVACHFTDQVPSAVASARSAE